MEKLNLDGDSTPKTEVRRDVVESPASLVSKMDGGRSEKEAD